MPSENTQNDDTQYQRRAHAHEATGDCSEECPWNLRGVSEQCVFFAHAGSCVDDAATRCADRRLHKGRYVTFKRSSRGGRSRRDERSLSGPVHYSGIPHADSKKPGPVVLYYVDSILFPERPSGQPWCKRSCAKNRNRGIRVRSPGRGSSRCPLDSSRQDGCSRVATCGSSRWTRRDTATTCTKRRT